MVNVVMMNDSRTELESRLKEEKQKYIVLTPAVARFANDGESMIYPGSTAVYDAPDEYNAVSGFLPCPEYLGSCEFSLIPFVRSIIAEVRYLAEKEKMSTVLIPVSFCNAVAYLKSVCGHESHNKMCEREIPMMIKAMVNEIFTFSSIKSGSVVICLNAEQKDMSEMKSFVDVFLEGVDEVPNKPEKHDRKKDKGKKNKKKKGKNKKK